MQTPRTLLNRFLLLGAVAGMMTGTSCTSAKLSRATPPAAPETAVVANVPVASAPTGQGAQTASATEVYAAAENTIVTAEVTSTLQQARQEAAAKTVAQKQNAVKKLSLPARIALKAAVKKIEKAQSKNDIKGEKQSKMAQALEQWLLIGIIAASVGLLLMLLTYGGAFALGLLLFLGGGVLILLSLLDVI